MRLRTTSSRSDRLALLLLALAVTAVTSLGIGVRSTYAGRAAVDEPEYLLTALSLGEDGDLDIADELAEERWRTFHDSELPVQTSVLDDGRRISPHDPLLPLLLALPMRWGGFVAAKLALCAVAGVLAMVTAWTAVRRFSVRPEVALPVVGLLAITPPLSVYASQVYPEVVAALAVMTSVALVTGPLRWGAVVGIGVAITALPWLSVKYTPTALALAAIVLLRLWRRGDAAHAVGLGGALTVMAAGYLSAHRLLYGGWTAYATGDHFEGPGEFAVVGSNPDIVGRALRLSGLLVDRGFGLVPWQPAWLVLVPALGFALRRRSSGWPALVVPLVVGYLTAVFVALTMHGFWWPGRQLVVVLPLAVLLICQWADGSVPRAAGVLGAACVGLLTFGGLLVDGWATRLTWVTGFEGVGAPSYRLLRPVLPDYRVLDASDWTLHVGWSVALLGLGLLGWRGARRPPYSPTSTVPAR